MTGKRFTDIEHDYENAWIKCNDNGMFMMYSIYEDDTGLPTLGDLLNGLNDENRELKQLNNNCELLIQLIENQGEIIEELYTKLLEYQFEENQIITLTKEDLEVMGKALSYYTHGRCGE